MLDNQNKVNGFFLYNNQCDALLELPAEQAIEVIRACRQFCAGNEPTITDPIVRCVFGIMKPSISISIKKAQSGRKGGEAKANNAKQNVANASNDVASSSKGVANASNDLANCSNDVANASNDVANASKPKQSLANKNKNEYKNKSIYPPISPPRGQASTSDDAFIPPTLAEVTAYIREKKLDIDPEQFIATNERKGWVVGKEPMKSWKHVLQTWIRRRRADSESCGDELFEAMWEEYPRKENKGAAFKEYTAAKKKGILPDDIVKRIHWRKFSDDWLKDGGQFVPQLEKWLNNQGWNDEDCFDEGEQQREEWAEELEELNELSRNYNGGMPREGETLDDTYARINKWGPLYNAKRDDMIARGCRCV